MVDAETDAAAWNRVINEVAWELLYRVEPELYERLTLAEKLQPEIKAFLPKQAERALEIGAGAGRLTLELATRCRELIAVEPSAPMRRLLRRRLADRDLSNTRVINGFFDSLPLKDEEADLVISCSAFTKATSHGGEIGLREMERICSRGGMIAIIWPDDPEWFIERGFEPKVLPSEPQIEFASRAEGRALLDIFFPNTRPTVLEKGLNFPLSKLRSEVPRYLVYKSKR